MSAALPIPVIQLLQVLTVALGAPGVTGVIAKVEARLQGRRGPRIRQPYYDLAQLTGTDLPYALAATVRSSAGQIIRPAHLLAAAALFMVILHETGRIPVETHTGTNEFGMIEEARAFEHSGPYFALLKWGSELKQLILFTILADVFLAPWGLASTQRAGAVILAIAALLAKACAVGCLVAVIDNSFAKLRLFKITEFVSGAFLLAVLGVFTLYLGGG